MSYKDSIKKALKATGKAVVNTDLSDIGHGIVVGTKATGHGIKVATLAPKAKLAARKARKAEAIKDVEEIIPDFNSDIVDAMANRA